MTQKKPEDSKATQKDDGNIFLFKSLAGEANESVAPAAQESPQPPLEANLDEGPLVITGEAGGGIPAEMDVESSAKAMHARLAAAATELDAMRKRTPQGKDAEAIRDLTQDVNRVKERHLLWEEQCRQAGLKKLHPNRDSILYRMYNDLDESLQDAEDQLGIQNAKHTTIIIDRLEIERYLTEYFRKKPSSSVLAPIKSLAPNDAGFRVWLTPPKGETNHHVDFNLPRNDVTAGRKPLTPEMVQMMADLTIAQGYTEVSLKGSSKDRLLLEEALILRGVKIRNPQIDMRQFTKTVDIKAVRAEMAERWVTPDDVADVGPRKGHGKSVEQKPVPPHEPADSASAPIADGPTH